MTPSLFDVGRSIRLYGDVARFLFRMALHRADRLPSTAVADGLHEVRARCAQVLERAGVRHEVLHAERVPETGGLLFFWNQESHLDHLILPVAIPRPFVTLYNNAVARVPFYGAQLRAAGHLHVDRSDEKQWRASVARGARRAQAGECILVSPEGTRSEGRHLLPMKRGAFLLAAAAQRPIVCVTVIGGHQRLPRGSPIVRSGPLRVVFSDPIPTDGHREDDLAPLQAIVVATFEETKRRFAL